MTQPGNNSNNSYTPTDYAGHALTGAATYSERVGDSSGSSLLGKGGLALSAFTFASKVGVAYAMGNSETALNVAKTEVGSFAASFFGSYVGALAGIPGFKSERWPVNDRNGGRLQSGIRINTDNRSICRHAAGVRQTTVSRLRQNLSVNIALHSQIGQSPYSMAIRRKRHNSGAHVSIATSSPKYDDL
ncbi:hypothetical protein C8J35_12018 [Rhizobium sp. PP-F2F-G38]|nr:hypothetical protein C8J37_12118 [Rhizobium sp. PP-WC-1G-195]PYE92725.1 hypothetical protein C8J35_12018 [Rhizobium sp. PP-F2F-G38]TCP77246.1 hypothetical protein C8J31_12515 [Rhizobium sp. PP-CC-2G-626]